MDRELTPIEEAWLEALPAFLELNACRFGICSELQTAERNAKIGSTPEKREQERLRAERIKLDRQEAWDARRSWVEQLYIASRVEKIIGGPVLRSAAYGPAPKKD